MFLFQIFEELIKIGWEYKQNPKKDYFDQIMDILDDVNNFFYNNFNRMIFLINKGIILI